MTTYAIPAEPLTDALAALAARSGLSISEPNSGFGGVRSRPVEGRYTPREALERMLAGSGWRAEFLDQRTVRIVRVQARAREVPPRRAAPPRALFTEVEPLMVEATKRRAAPDSIADPVTAVPGSWIERTQAGDAADIAGQVAGLTVTNLGPGRDKLLIRGNSDGPFTGRTPSTGAVYLDDVRLSYNAPDPDLRLVDVTSVEVLRGPQGTLYGSGALGGIYRVVTRKPELDVLSGSLSATHAGTAAGQPSDAIDGMINLPLVRDRLALRVVGWSEVVGGYIDNLAPPLSDVNQTSRRGLRVALRGETWADWSLQAGFNGQTIDAEDSQYVTGDARRYRRTVGLKEPHENTFSEAYATVEGPTPWGRLSATTALVRHVLATRYDAAASAAAFGFDPGTPSPFDDRRDLRTAQQEIRLTSFEASPIGWMVGLFAASDRESAKILLDTPAGPGSGPIYREARTDELSEYAVFGQMSLPLPQNLSLEAGLRWFEVSKEADSQVLAPRTGQGSDFEGHTTTAGLAPKLSLTWRPSRQLTAYALVSEGYREGGLNTGGLVGQAFGTPGGGAQPYRGFGADHLWNYETGIKLRLFEGRLLLRGAAFYDFWHNLQTDQVTASGLAFTGNAGEGVNPGIEAEAAWTPRPELLLRANLMIDDPELIRANPSFPARHDAGLPSVPKVSGGLSASWAHPLGDGMTLSLDADAAYIGASHLTFDGRSGRSMGGYASARLQAMLETPRWRLSAFADNPLGVTGNTFSFGNPFSLAADNQIVPLRPRTVGVRLGWRF